MRKNPTIKIQDKVLILNFVGKESGSKGSETKDENKTKGTFSEQTLKMQLKYLFQYLILSSFFIAPATPKTTLFVSNLPYSVKEATLKTVFKTAVNIALPELDGKKRG